MFRDYLLYDMTYIDIYTYVCVHVCVCMYVCACMYVHGILDIIHETWNLKTVAAAEELKLSRKKHML